MAGAGAGAGAGTEGVDREQWSESEVEQQDMDRNSRERRGSGLRNRVCMLYSRQLMWSGPWQMVLIVTIAALVSLGGLALTSPLSAQSQFLPGLRPQSAIITIQDSNTTISARPASFGPSFPGSSSGNNGLNGGGDSEEYHASTLVEEEQEEDRHAGMKSKLNEMADKIRDYWSNADKPKAGSRLSKTENQSLLGVVHVSRVMCVGQKNVRDKIVVVMRGECSFYDKVMEFQKWGARAVIIGDNSYQRGLVTMYTREDTSKIYTPSAFITREAYDVLANSGPGTRVSITQIEGDTGPLLMNTVAFIMLSPLCSLSIIYGILLVHRRYRLMKERAPKSAVDKLPTRIWQGPMVSRSNSGNASVGIPVGGSSEQLESTGYIGIGATRYPERKWASAGECIICLDDYVEGESVVMQLPCGHEFHSACISRWLLSRKRTCPICKHDMTVAHCMSPVSIAD